MAAITAVAATLATQAALELTAGQGGVVKSVTSLAEILDNATRTNLVMLTILGFFPIALTSALRFGSWLYERRVGYASGIEFADHRLVHGWLQFAALWALAALMALNPLRWEGPLTSTIAVLLGAIGVVRLMGGFIATVRSPY